MNNTDSRVFDNGIVGHVTAIRGDGTTVVPQAVDERSGIISLPSEMLWSDVETRDDFHERRRNLVTGFQLAVSYETGRRIFVTQRNPRLHYRGPRSVSLGRELDKATLAPCEVAYAFRNGWDRDRYGPRAVWTRSMRNAAEKGGGSNRADCWILDEDGTLVLFQILVITLDDGKTFRLVGVERWRGQVCRRAKSLGEYQPYLASEDRRIAERWERSERVRRLMNTYVFRPAEAYEIFEKRWEVLENPRFAQYLEEIAGNLKEEDQDDWRIDLEHKLVRLEDGAGVVKFQTFGLGQDSFAIVQLPRPVTVGDSPVQWTEVRLHGRELDVPDDRQSLKILMPGDIVEYGDIQPSLDGQAPRLVDVTCIYQKAAA